jgi:hypothetical protein
MRTFVVLIAVSLLLPVWFAVDIFRFYGGHDKTVLRRLILWVCKRMEGRP